MTDKQNNTLLLFTVSYPYSLVGESFLDNEIPYLSAIFQKIIIISTEIPLINEKSERKLPKNVIIDNSYLHNVISVYKKNSYSRKILTILQVITNKYFFLEILKDKENLFNRTILIDLIIHISCALNTERWIDNYIKNNDLNLSNTVFYTYWLSKVTTGIAFVKENEPGIKLISRVHRWDLYEQKKYPPFIHYRPEIFKYVNQLYAISNHGKNYLTSIYPSINNICTVARLGVPDPKFTTKPSNDGILRILSCSYLVPVKRIDLLIEGLGELKKINPNLKILWTHIGNGPLLNTLKKSARDFFPEKKEFEFLGFIPDVLSFYKYNNIDVFINVSKSEGIPVSIMEAQSCGVPVIATNVGGTSEIISEQVGILLGENPTPLEIALAISSFAQNSKDSLLKRKKSKYNWENNFNSDINYSSFAQMLKKI